MLCERWVTGKSFRGRLDQVGRAHAELRAALDMLITAAEHAAPPPPSR
jgi:hypothetical protein